MMDESIAGRRVLIVEDDYFLAMEMAAILKRAGAEVIGPVAQAKDALDALSHQPEAVMLDLRLGDDSSLALASELSGRCVPYVFVTGWPSDLPQVHGAHTVISKPFEVATMLRALSGALRRDESGAALSSPPGSL